MRYDKAETPIAAGILPTGSAVTVKVLNQATNALLALTSNAAVESVIPGVYNFNLGNITTPPLGFTQVVVEFTSAGGAKDYCKIVVRGYVDDVTRTRKIVGSWE